MFRKWMIVCLLIQIGSSDKFDQNICPDGLTTFSVDSPWPKRFPNHFQILAELTTDVESLEITQTFLGPHRDMVELRNFQTNLRIYSDFELQERLIIDERSICAREKIQLNQSSPFFVSEYLKPSVLLGFNEINQYNPNFFTQYLGKHMLHDAVLTEKFQSCFVLSQFNLTINATYYLIERSSIVSDVVRIDVRTNDYPYTYNIIQYQSHPFLKITTPASIFCADRINTKGFPRNLPNGLSLHVEAYTLANRFLPSKIDSYDHFIDEYSQIERLDYTITDLLTPSRLLTDYSMNLTYMYTHETQQCSVLSTSGRRLMGSVNEMLFHIRNDNHSIEYQYTGLDDCGRDYLQCHRWIGRYEVEDTVEEIEWYWSGKYQETDVDELVPIKIHLKTKFSDKTIQQEIHIFNYHSLANPVESIDSTLADCYRSLGADRHFNYAVLRFTLDNEANYPVHRYLLSIERDLHSQLALHLQIRPIRLSSFLIDIDAKHNDIHVTFTLLDNPMQTTDSSIEFIEKLARDINEKQFSVRISDGGFDLTARPNSLRTLASYVLPRKNQTIFVYQNNTQTIVTKREKFLKKFFGLQILALWTSFVLLSLIGTLIIGTVLAMRKRTPCSYPQSR